MKQLPYRCSVFKMTRDNWYPSYLLTEMEYGNTAQNRPEDKLVCVSLSKLPHGSDWRVSVWGADDCGMECDFDKNSRRRAQELFQEVIEQEFVNRSWLKSKGFVNA